MKKIFISQSMNNIDDAIIKNRTKLIQEKLTKKYGDVEFIESFINETPIDQLFIAVWYLGESIKRMSNADIVYFDAGWQQSRGCMLEHEIALAYGMTIIEDYGTMVTDEFSTIKEEPTVRIEEGEPNNG